MYSSIHFSSFSGLQGSYRSAAATLFVFAFLLLIADEYASRSLPHISCTWLASKMYSKTPVRNANQSNAKLGIWMTKQRERERGQGLPCSVSVISTWLLHKLFAKLKFIWKSWKAEHEIEGLIKYATECDWQCNGSSRPGRQYLTIWLTQKPQTHTQNPKPQNP